MQNDFNLDPDLIYVNHAAVAPWPVCTVEAVKQFAIENGTVGSSHYLNWLKVEQELKADLATLINAQSADEIALLKNTSEGLSIIARGIQWQPGDNIVISNEEFPSNFIAWDALRAQGVELRIANISDTDYPEKAIIEQMDANTRLLSISAVQYASGLRMNLDVLGKACKTFHALYCVDAIQQIGALQFDVQSIDADFVIADGHKWMLGPEGLALFYCKQSSMDELELQQFGWHMVEDLSDFNNMKNWQAASNARRFECGSPNTLTTHALHASIKLLLQHGMSVIEKAVLLNIQTLIQTFSQLPDTSILSPTDITRHGGIFTFRKNNVDNEALYQYLVKKGAVCAPRGGGIRLSPHYYNQMSEFEKLAEWVEEYKA
ncbi:MAG: aminotransferase [endosymbiont of Galathealinum brachiosum]|uniref:Aminotransferase n=1 Tax=endosymbiont of Galathealinum brachiosum TaxID=2200906 RepID=A0A370DNS5_9GAMM|nr:MAG: aminotransferase [endosymbiont of Galathealinum brachiosum]